MKKPTWAKVVGVIGIILGCFGLLGASQTIIMPKTIEMQKTMMPQMQERMQKSIESQNLSPEQVQQTMRMMQEMWQDTPEWFNTWCIVSGIIALLIAVFYIYVSIGILRVQTSAIKMFYIAAGISICFAIIKGLVAMKALSFIGMSIMGGGIFGIIINIILLIVVAKGDKQAFALIS
jgi:hypothetical protein